LPELCAELRNFVIDTLSDNPGHFGASLGVVELSVAIHYVYDTPDDKLVWDVGHQAYIHKILTGRKDVFHTNRKYKGISGFPKISESEYDNFGTGHSSTSVSAALGMAVSSQLNGIKNRQHIAIIGDGAMSGGEAFEGLNNAGVSQANLTVILNDNGISIDKSVGALKEHLVKITTSRAYNQLKDKTWTALGLLGTKGPSPLNIVRRIGNAIKSTFIEESEYTESLNMRYFGPIKGNDVKLLVHTLELMKRIKGPKMLHIITKKGKGFKMAEKDQTTYHAPGKFDKNTGEIRADKSVETLLKYQDVFGHTLLELADKDENIVAITPAMPSGSSLTYMMKKYPERTIDVGIAEQHAVTFAAGLATQGKKAFCSLYSTFMQRAYDQIIHDVALQKLPVVFPIDRGGLVGADGPTHHGCYDLAYLRAVPNMIISSPMNEHELRNLMFTAYKYNEGPFAIRYPRGKGVLIDWKNEMQQIEIGKARIIEQGENIAIFSIGPIGNLASKAIEMLKEKDINPTHIDFRFLKPFDEKLVKEILDTHKYILSVEDGTILGGLGSLLAESITENNSNNKLVKLGIPDKFIAHGTQAELYKECGYDADGIYNSVLKFFK
jgi:1-deoxy-D-xylulose-5-phosphate synthase